MRLDPAAVKRLRVLAGLRQRQLAEKISCAPSYISEMERGKTAGSVSLYLKLAEVFDCEISELVIADEEKAS